ncbi:MAG: AzlD domain-containing protein [Actinomyces sp.]|nr:MAG: AzlD domain-containing protein [Actinomyces sp.]
MSWPALIVLAAGAYGFKVLGLVLVGDRLPLALRPLAALLPAALFAALVVVQTVGGDGTVVVDARLAGTGAAAVAAWRRAPFAAVVVVAMAATAAVRAAGWG